MTWGRYGLALLTAALAAVCCGCGRGALIAVKDSSGTAVELQSPARRIVSTVPSNTEILYALGLADRVVGVTKFCRKTCDVTGKFVIGGWVDPDYEEIRRLTPDLIFAFGGLQRRCLAEFRKIASTYFFEPVTVEETLEGVLEIGDLTGRSNRAEEIVAEQRAVLARVKSGLAPIATGEKPRVARIFGTARKVLSMGRRSFLTDVIELAGRINVFGDIEADYFHIEFERLAAVDPDVLIVQGEKPEEVRAAFKASPHFGKLKAVRDGRVLVYSCDHICHPNATVGETVAMVARGLHPGLFAGEGEK